MKMRLSDLQNKLKEGKEAVSFFQTWHPLIDISEVEIDLYNLNDLLYNININRNYPHDVWVDTKTGEVEE